MSQILRNHSDFARFIHEMAVKDPDMQVHGKGRTCAEAVRAFHIFYRRHLISGEIYIPAVYTQALEFFRTVQDRYDVIAWLNLKVDEAIQSFRQYTHNMLEAHGTERLHPNVTAYSISGILPDIYDDHHDGICIRTLVFAFLRWSPEGSEGYARTIDMLYWTPCKSEAMFHERGAVNKFAHALSRAVWGVGYQFYKDVLEAYPDEMAYEGGKTLSEMHTDVRHAIHDDHLFVKLAVELAIRIVPVGFEPVVIRTEWWERDVLKPVVRFIDAQRLLPYMEEEDIAVRTPS